MNIEILNASAPGYGPVIDVSAVLPRIGPARAYTGGVSGTGAVAATIAVQVCNSAAGVAAGRWQEQFRFTLSDTTSVLDLMATMAPWNYVRCQLISISGTGAIATCNMGY